MNDGDGFIGRVYSDAQREAIVKAWDNPRLSSPQIAAMAAAGELIGPDGRLLAPFNLPTTTIRSMARRERQRLDPDDLGAANRRLIRDLLRVANTELRAIKTRPAGKRDMRKLAQLVTIHARVEATLRDSDTQIQPAPVSAPPLAMGSLMAAHRADNGDGGEVG
jgi:hypothetical protein